jgi:glucokinase
LAHEIEGIKSDVKEIKGALLGNDFTNKTGLIHTIAEHHQRLTQLERIVQNFKWLIIGLSVGTGFGVAKLIEIFIKALS